VCRAVNASCDIFMFHNKSAFIDRPVLVRFPAMGDTVMLTALIEALARRYQSKVDVLASGGWVPELLSTHPHVGSLQMITTRRGPYWLRPVQWRAVHWLRQRAPQSPIYFCEQDEHSKALIDRAGLPEERFIRVTQHPAGPHEHWVDWWMRIAQLTPVSVPIPPASVSIPAVPYLYCTPSQIQECKQWLGENGWGAAQLILLQPGNKKTHQRGRVGTRDHAKYWPEECWAEVAIAILKRLPHARVLVCGSPREAGLTESIVRLAQHPQVISVARELPLSRFMGLTTIAHSMVSVDTGPAHVAAALGCDCVVLYGAAHGAARWKPRSVNARVIALGSQFESGGPITDIEVGDVLNAWSTLNDFVS
jgi:heptosyltransferase III